jgi:hypothetical protein
MKTKRLYGFNPEDSLIDTIREQSGWIESKLEILEREPHDEVELKEMIREIADYHKTLASETIEFITWVEEHREKYCEWLVKTKDTREV